VFPLRIRWAAIAGQGLPRRCFLRLFIKGGKALPVKNRTWCKAAAPGKVAR
jgi:hypothetical protein